ncbi:MAG: aminoacyl-tRNA hydrolase [Nitrospirota bacterium]|nr:aminoacyl-tRNA hydrolase [Nitrospirota bacterium]MDH5767364.1 aminoacyl-tRNA hydrolase [Nitrospirota bacterium]
MWVIAGLGNPGSKYSRTRHNIGFMVTEEIARIYGIDLKEKQEKYKIGRGSIDREHVLLLEPLLYMNRSGFVIRDIVSKFNIQPENLIVIHDDLDMEVGKIKIRKKSSSGGHKGVESIIQNIVSKDFVRVKIGIGRDNDISAEDYVLKRFRKDEIPLIKAAITRASDAVTSIILDGPDKAMNVFNKSE